VIRLRFPRVPTPASVRLPAELRWDAGRATIAVLVSRRQFLKALALVLAAFALPFTRAERGYARARGRFFTRRERQTLEALCDRVIPPDHDPGAQALGAVRYIEGMLTALDRGRPRIFAGGPFSGRNPFPDNSDGTPSRRRPRNRFKQSLPLTRLQELRWRAELFGSGAVPEVQPLDAHYGGPLKGLRDVYREGLAKVDEVAVTVAGAPFAELEAAQQDEVFAMLDDGAFARDPRRGDDTFVDLVIRHTLEGCFAPPEYGGNRRRAGWAMLGLEGDSQPLGYSIFSEAAAGYEERADHPMSTPNPDELGPGDTVQPRPLTPDGAHIQNSIATFTAIFDDGVCS